MAFLDDFLAAVKTYPTSNVTIQIVDRSPVPPATTPEVNINEKWKFQVRIRNNGHLNMNRVQLRVEGQNGTTVSTTENGAYSASILFGNFSVGAHRTVDTADLFFRAPNTRKTDPQTLLLRALINHFDADLNDILIAETGAAALPVGEFKTEVFP